MPSRIAHNLVEAQKIVLNTDIEEEFHVAAYEYTLKEIGRNGTSRDYDNGKSRVHAGEPLETTLLARVSDSLGIPLEIVNQVFSEDGEAVAIEVAPSQLDKKDATALRQCAVLGAIAVQIGQGESSISQSDLLKRAATLNVHYKRNLARDLTSNKMKELFEISGETPNLQFKLRRSKHQYAAEYIQSLIKT